MQQASQMRLSCRSILEI